MRSFTGKLLAVFIPLALLGVATWAFTSTSVTRAGSPPSPARTPVPAATLKAAPAAPLWGLSVPYPMQQHLDALDSTLGGAPAVIAAYQRFGSPFRDSQASQIEKDGAVPLLQWNPTTVRLAAIADGRYDGYLRSYAKAVRKFRSSIIISFGHEMNGPWWKWSHGHQSAASFVAAWRHIHDVFAAAGAKNVTWLWNPNVIRGPAVADPEPWWPGTRYVDWTGLDGYLWTRQQTFTSVFSAAIKEMHKLAPGKPVMIAETGAYPGTGMGSRIAGLFAGAKAAHIRAVVYFDHVGQSDWRIEKNKDAIAALRMVVKEHR